MKHPPTLLHDIGFYDTVGVGSAPLGIRAHARVVCRACASLPIKVNRGFGCNNNFRSRNMSVSCGKKSGIPHPPVISCIYNFYGRVWIATFFRVCYARGLC